MTADIVETEDGVPEPRANPDLAGHEVSEQFLLNGFQSGRLAHAWLFCGPPGIGKATLAYRFARYVLSAGGLTQHVDPNQDSLFGEEPVPENHADGLALQEGHPVFQRVKSGGHADLMSVERQKDEKTGKQKSEIVVDDVRPIGPFLNLTAAEGGWRVVVIDAADDMNRSAANALLKVLEEPPAKALLLLVSHNPGRLLPTIRSRCQRLVMKPLEESALQGLLLRYRPDLSPDDAGALARLAEGSIGRALSLAEEGGVGLYREFMDLIADLPTLDIKSLHAFGDKLARPGQEEAFRTFMALSQGWLNRLMINLSLPETKNATFSDAEQVLMDRLKHQDSRPDRLGAWLDAQDHINHIFSRAESAYLDKKQVTLSLFHALEKAAMAA
jgi:DNA polymerase-3 subunit delta'